MLKNLVIVESPAKAKTIEKFLGKDYKVMSSQGHIRDLSKKHIGVDIEHDFEPLYEISPDKADLVAELKKAAAQAKTIWLASDEDREGEAIAWHLYEVLGLKPDNTRRIVFHEITKPAILAAIAQPRDIDMGRVDAQQARRVLDRIVGFEVSPILWRKVKVGLSAGRVQSVALRLIADRETEIRAFVPEEYMRVNGIFATADGVKMRAELSRRLADPAAAQQFLTDCRGADFTVANVQKKPVKKTPAPPFTTSTLQQEASRKLGMSVAQTMSVAQRLYEAGHITYMRTDSLNLSSLALEAIAKQITDNLGAPYLAVRHYHTHSKGAQEAHEAIRPTYVEKREVDGSVPEKRLYDLIWKRAVASQMADAQIERTTAEINISTRPEHFTVTGETVKFDGFLRLYREGTDNEPSENSESSENSEGVLPQLQAGQNLKAVEITAAERLTLHPQRYTEASLVKKLEDLGIGRPSTYAPTISTILARGYIEKGDRPGTERQFTTMTLDAKGNIDTRTVTEVYGSDRAKLLPTDVGMVVNRYLTEWFPNILDYNFTAQVEEQFDEIASGTRTWHDQIAEFYKDFHPGVVEAEKARLERKVGERLLGEDPATGKPVFAKIGRFGPMVQIGDANDQVEHPAFASLLKNQSLDTITLDEALKLFEYPKHLGQYEGQEMTVAIGRFGPYVKHKSKFVSIPKGIDPATITHEQAIELIEAKRAADRAKIVKTFDDEPKLQILNGRFGVYIAYDGANYKIPKTVSDPASLTVAECMELVNKQAAAPRKKSARATAKTRKK